MLICCLAVIEVHVAPVLLLFVAPDSTCLSLTVLGEHVFLGPSRSPRLTLKRYKHRRWSPALDNFTVYVHHS